MKKAYYTESSDRGSQKTLVNNAASCSNREPCSEVVSVIQDILEAGMVNVLLNGFSALFPPKKLDTRNVCALSLSSLVLKYVPFGCDPIACCMLCNHEEVEKDVQLSRAGCSQRLLYSA